MKMFRSYGVLLDRAKTKNVYNDDDDDHHDKGDEQERRLLVLNVPVSRCVTVGGEHGGRGSYSTITEPSNTVYPIDIDGIEGLDERVKKIVGDSLGEYYVKSFAVRESYHDMTGKYNMVGGGLHTHHTHITYGHTTFNVV